MDILNLIRHNYIRNSIIRYDIIGYILLISIFYSILIPSILWWFKLSIQPYIFPLAILLSFLHFCTHSIPIRELILVALLLLLTSILNKIVPDMSWDGQAYHQPMVYALAHGWNPIYYSHNPIIDPIWNMNIWIDHYPKGMEISAATIASTTGDLEIGKSVNTLFMLSALTTSLYHLNKCKAFLTNYKIIIYSILFACPMVFINYGFTFYIDVATYYLIFWLMTSIYILEKKYYTKIIWFILFVIVALSACIKWNTFFWVCFFITFYVVYLILTRNYKRLCSVFFISASSILFVIITVNYNPIITNFNDHKNPIYPIGTKEANAIDINAMPDLLRNKNRITQVLTSFFSRPNDNKETPYLSPYPISYRYNIRSLGFGAKLGGGGFFFMEIIIISIILLFLSKENINKRIIVYVSLLFILTPFVLPFGSNYRYIPYISLLPIVILLYTEKTGFISKSANKAKTVCLILLCINNLISVPFFLKNTFTSAKSQINAIHYISKSKRTDIYRSKNWSFNYKINGNHIINKEIFSDNIENYIAIPNQFGPPIYMHKVYFEKETNPE